MTQKEYQDKVKEVEDSSVKVKLLYLLRDLGIQSAYEAMNPIWEKHMNTLGELSVGG